jgi:hypothetical protein
MKTQPSSSTTLKTGTATLPRPRWMPDCDECGAKNAAVVKSHGYLMCGDCAMKELKGGRGN